MISAAPLVRLLVIDDDPILCDLLQHTLPSHGFAVSAESSPLEALQRVKHDAERFDTILIDSQMPECHGAELASRLREHHPGFLLIGMSATAPPSAELQAFDEFLLKPFTPTQLRQLVDTTKSSDAGFGYAADAANAPPRDVYPDALPETERRNAPGKPAQADARHRKNIDETRVLDTRIFEQLRATLGLEPLRQLYEMTVNDVVSRLERMRTSLLAGDRQLLRAQAHAIKGSCAMVGATELSQLADRIELGSETDMVQLNAIEQACIRLRQVVTIVPP